MVVACPFSYYRASQPGIHWARSSQSPEGSCGNGNKLSGPYSDNEGRARTTTRCFNVTGTRMERNRMGRDGIGWDLVRSEILPFSILTMPLILSISGCGEEDTGSILISCGCFVGILTIDGHSIQRSRSFTHCDTRLSSEGFHVCLHWTGLDLSTR